MPALNKVSAAWNTVGALRRLRERPARGRPALRRRLPGREPRHRRIGPAAGRAGDGPADRARATGAGALSGLWAGLLVGILLGLFTSGHSFLAVIVTGAALGAGWGAAFGYLAHARTRGERDFSSVRGLTATHYDLIAREGTVDRARRMLGDAGLLPETANEW